MAANKQCEKCARSAVKGQRFCVPCKKVVLKEQSAAGYFTKGGTPPWHRFPAKYEAPDFAQAIAS